MIPILSWLFLSLLYLVLSYRCDPSSPLLSTFVILLITSFFFCFLIAEVLVPAPLGEEQMALIPLGTFSFPPSVSFLISLLLLFHLRFVSHCYLHRRRGTIHIGVCVWCCWTLAWKMVAIWLSYPVIYLTSVFVSSFFLSFLFWFLCLSLVILLFFF